ncbi:MAG: very short patch repair endonuclease [Gammaproteobacteria bacterium]|nr:very short patch repair endonuclease [Gammaproteobacteria bacterium]
MGDKLTPEQRSRLMAKIKGQNTGPEMLLRQALWAEGMRYRLHCGASLPGKPDIVFVRARLAVFVDGCFWHGCPLHGHTPKSSKEYWLEKLKRNMARDKDTNRKLSELGWQPIRLWEHEINDDVSACVKRIAKAVRLRKQH